MTAKLDCVVNVRHCLRLRSPARSRARTHEPMHSFLQVYSILDEFILAGEIQETSKREILERIRDMHAYEKASEK